MVDTEGMRRLDLKEAAAELGVTSEAIRRRAKRGTLASEKGEDGRLYVWVHAVSDSGVHAVSDSGVHAGEPGGDGDLLPAALLARVEDENDFLRREVDRLHRDLERKDAILLTLAQRVPELEPRRADLSPSEESSNDYAPPENQEHSEQRSWWRRLFEG